MFSYMSINHIVRNESSRRFDEARRRAFFAGLLDMLHRQSTTLLPFEEVRARLNVQGQRFLGQQTVALDRIIGSEGRYTDFDRRFLPRTNTNKQRWVNIDSAMRQDVHLPPVELYKIGDIYFVRDGNHRVSTARENGQEFIDAVVTELVVDVPLDASLSMRDLILKEEYSDFLEWTDLHKLRPDERIEFSQLGGYLDLVRHINAHRYYLEQERQAPVERDEAVAHWYDSVYMPVVQAIREQNILSQFPERTEADLYCWIMDHRWYMRERLGSDPGPQVATSDYASRYGEPEVALFLRDMLRKLGVGRDEE